MKNHLIRFILMPITWTSTRLPTCFTKIVSVQMAAPCQRVPNFIMILNIKTTLSVLWIGNKQIPTANGVMPACPPKLNGKKLRAAQMDALTHGAKGSVAIKLLILAVKVLPLKSEATKAERVPTAFITWQIMCGNGQTIGMMKITTLVHLIPILWDLIRDKTECYAVAHGAVVKRPCALPVATGFLPELLVKSLVFAVCDHFHSSMLPCSKIL